MSEGIRNIHFVVTGTIGERKDGLKPVNGKKISHVDCYIKGLDAFENELGIEVEPTKEPLHKHSMLLLDPAKDVINRKFDVMLGNMWVPMDFKLIQIESIFRIWDDEKVFSTDGFKKFKKMNIEKVKDNQHWVEVLPIK